MDSDGLPIVGPAIDLTKVTSINQKRTIAFLNHFIAHTVNFLNRFSCVCEEKLSDLSNRLQRVDVTMSILEAKLASIPGLENVTVEDSASSATQQQQQQQQQQEQPTNQATNGHAPSTSDEQQSVTTPEEDQSAVPVVVEAEPAEQVMTVAKDPRYAKYFQMMKVGVPLAALRGKVLADGLNPDLLETPDAPSPGGGATQVSMDSDEDDDSSASSFTDEDD